MAQPAQADDILGFAEAMATRLCHDVAGLASTLAGTLEMALEDAQQSGDGEAAMLATESASLLGARIKLYRAAWGGGDIDAGSVGELSAGLPNRAKLTLHVDPALESGSEAGPAQRLLLCTLLAACAALPAGGTVAAEKLDGGAFAVTLSGRNAAWPAALASDGVAPDARGLAAPMARLVAGACGWRLAADGLRLTATPGSRA